MASVGFGSVSGAIWGNIVLRLGNRAIETDVRRRKPFGEHFGPAGRWSTTFRNRQQRSIRRSPAHQKIRCRLSALRKSIAAARIPPTTRSTWEVKYRYAQGLPFG